MPNDKDPGSANALEPHATIGAFAMSENNPDRCGFLRKRGHKERVLENLHLSKHINWRQKFVAIKDGCCYCFADETAKAPSQVFSLKGYNRVSRKTSERACAFCVEPASRSGKKILVFASMNDADRKMWMQSFRKAMVEANSSRDTPHKEQAFQSEGYSDIEKPVFDSDTDSFDGESSCDRHTSQRGDGDDSDDSEESDYDRPDDDVVKAAITKMPERRPLPPTPPQIEGGDQNGQRWTPTAPPRKSSRNKPLDQRRREPEPPLPPKPKPDETPPKSRSKPDLPHKPARRLSERDCLFDNSDREVANGILREKKVPGTFLIRRSRQGDGKVLAVLTAEGVKEYKIFTESNRVSLDKMKFFDNVDDLLENYTKCPLPNREQTLGRSYSIS